MIKKFRLTVILEEDYCHGIGFVHGINIQIANYLNDQYNVNQGGHNYIIKNRTIQSTKNRYFMVFHVKLGEYDGVTECPENMARVIVEQADSIFQDFHESGAYCKIRELFIQSELKGKRVYKVDLSTNIVLDEQMTREKWEKSPDGYEGDFDGYCQQVAECLATGEPDDIEFNGTQRIA